MAKEFPQKLRAWILWEAGHRTPKSMRRRGSISERTAEKYIADFRRGGTWERNPYPQRYKPKQAPKVVNKVTKKAKGQKRINSLASIAKFAGVSPSQARINRMKMTIENEGNLLKY